MTIIKPYGIIPMFQRNGPLVKRLRHGPLTAVTWVRFPYGSPKKQYPNLGYCFFVILEQIEPLKSEGFDEASGCGNMQDGRTKTARRVLIPVRVTKRKDTSRKRCVFSFGGLFRRIEARKLRGAHGRLHCQTAICAATCCGGDFPYGLSSEKPDCKLPKSVQNGLGQF